MDRARPSRDRAGALFVSLAVHLGAIGLLIASRVASPPTPSAPVSVQLVSLDAPKPQPPDRPEPNPPTPPAPEKTRSRHARAAAPSAPAPRPAPKTAAPRSDARPTPVTEAVAVAPAQLSAGELAGAASAGEGTGVGDGGGASGGGGGGASCDMPARVQSALRRDGLVRQALAAGGPSSTAFRMWNGDWVRDPREDGKGLAAVREAILWAVGFAPRECRSQAVRGLVVVSIDTSAGRVRLALGAPAWRWSDLLGSR